MRSYKNYFRKEGHNKELTPYLMFKYAIKTDISRSIMKEG